MEMPAANQDEEVLYFRCSDGRTERPDSIYGKCAHQIRKAGGALNAYYKARFSCVGMSLEDRIRDQMEDIETMIELKKKNLRRVIIASHAHCGAAIALGLSHGQVLALHEEWGQRMRDKYPDIEVEVLHEEHTECGTSREWKLVASGK